MKKTMPKATAVKLQLHRETLRLLEEPRIELAVGGFTAHFTLCFRTCSC